jgi:hypothetical protein
VGNGDLGTHDFAVADAVDASNPAKEPAPSKEAE